MGSYYKVGEKKEEIVRIGRRRITYSRQMLHNTDLWPDLWGGRHLGRNCTNPRLSGEAIPRQVLGAAVEHEEGPEGRGPNSSGGGCSEDAASLMARSGR